MLSIICEFEILRTLFFSNIKYNFFSPGNSSKISHKLLLDRSLPKSAMELSVLPHAIRKSHTVLYMRGGGAVAPLPGFGIKVYLVEHFLQQLSLVQKLKS